MIYDSSTNIKLLISHVFICYILIEIMKDIAIYILMKKWSKYFFETGYTTPCDCKFRGNVEETFL